MTDEQHQLIRVQAKVEELEKEKERLRNHIENLSLANKEHNARLQFIEKQSTEIAQKLDEELKLMNKQSDEIKSSVNGINLKIASFEGSIKGVNKTTNIIIVFVGMASPALVYIQNHLAK